MSREHEAVDGGFVCWECEPTRTFKTPLGYERHRQQHHRRDR